MTEQNDAPARTVFEGKWISVRKQGRWEYATRSRGISAAVILPLDGDDVILIEQKRVPVGKRVLELPAGLIGDEEGAEDGDDPMAAAKRELEEETGFAASEWTDMGYYLSSPGMTDEGFTLLRARGLTKVGEGGGLESEDITVHRVPLTDLPRFVSDFREGGGLIDVRVLMVMSPWLLR